MRPSAVKEALKTAIKAKQPVMIQGSPGGGKSQVTLQVKEELFGPDEASWRDLRLSQLDPVDLRGIPYADMKNKTTSWLPPDFLPRSGKGVLFLDEINSAANATQAAAYQLILDRRLGDYVLPDGWAMVAAGNKMSDRAIVNQMSTALRNRFVHIDYEVHHEDWCTWAIQKNIHPSVIAYIRFKPQNLNEFEAHGKSKEEKDRVARLKDANAFATPRSWEFLSRIVDAEPSKEIENELFAGCVGEGIAAEYISHLKMYRDLPNLDGILMNPAQAPVPKEPAVLYSLMTGLATKATEDNFDRVVKYLNRIEEKEFQVLCVKDSMLRNQKICQTKSFNKWAVDNSMVLL